MSMATLHGIFVVATVLYAVASCGYFLFAMNGSQHVSTWSMRTLCVAVAGHTLFLAGDWQTAFASVGTGALDVRRSLVLASLLIALAFLAALRFHKLTVLGAFVTPVILLVLLGASLGSSIPHVSPQLRSALLPAHILANVLGIAAFTLAFGIALAYLIQERLLRRRQLGGLFQRLPPLEVLDSLGLKMLMIGFPLFTLGTALGTIWAVRATAISTGHVFGVVAWLVFAGVLLLRLVVGWQGRRAALGTLLGFACAMAVLAGYALRAVESTT